MRAISSWAVPGADSTTSKASPGRNACAAARSTSKNATPAFALRTTTGNGTVLPWIS